MKVSIFGESDADEIIVASILRAAGVGEIERSAAAFIVEYRGSGFNVWALKGQLNLKDSNGSSTVLQGKVNAGAAQLPTPHHVKAKWITIQVSE